MVEKENNPKRKYIPLEDIEGEERERVQAHFIDILSKDKRGLEEICTALLQPKAERKKDVKIRLGLANHVVDRMIKRKPYLLSVVLSRKLERLNTLCVIKNKQKDIRTKVRHVWNMPIGRADAAIASDLSSLAIYVFPYGTFILDLLQKGDRVTGYRGLQGVAITYIDKIPKWSETKRYVHNNSLQQKMDSQPLMQWVFGILHRKHLKKNGQYIDGESMLEDLEDLRDSLNMMFDVR